MPLFTDGQRRVFAFCLALFAFVASAALIITLIVLFGRVIGFFANVLWPLAVAGILALILRPMVDVLEKRFKGRRLAAVLVLYGAFICLVTAFLVSIIPPLAAQIVEFITSLPELWTNAVTYVKANYPNWVLAFDRVMANAFVSGAVESVRTQLGKMASLIVPSLVVINNSFASVLHFITALSVIPIYLFFFLLTKRDFGRKLPQNLPFLREPIRSDVVFLVREFVAIVVSFFRGQLVIGLIMGGLYAAGFTAIGLKFGLFIGLVLGVLNIIPYLGTIIGLAVTIPLAFFQTDGGIQLVMLVLLVKVIVQSVESWILTPKIMGDRTGLHPLMIIVAIFFWGTAFDGVLGMVLAIPLTAFFVTAWRLLNRKYFTQS